MRLFERILNAAFGVPDPPKPLRIHASREQSELAAMLYLRVAVLADDLAETLEQLADVEPEPNAQHRIRAAESFRMLRDAASRQMNSICDALEGNA